MGDKPTKKTHLSATIEAILFKIADLCTPKFRGYDVFDVFDDLVGFGHLMIIGSLSILLGISIGINFTWFVVFPIFALIVYAYKRWMKQYAHMRFPDNLGNTLYVLYIIIVSTLATDITIDLMQPESIVAASIYSFFQLIGVLFGGVFNFFFGGPPVL